MASRYYLTFRGLDTQFFSDTKGDWDDSISSGERDHGLVDYTRMLSTSKALGGSNSAFSFVFTNLTIGAGPQDVDARFLRWVTPGLAAQTLSGCTLTPTLGSRSFTQPGVNVTLQWKLHVWLARYNAVDDTWDNARTLLDNYVNPTAFPDDGGLGHFLGFDVPQTLANGAIAAGDRIVVEIGQRYINPNVDPAAGSQQFSLRFWGGTLVGGVPGTDGVNGNTDVTTKVSWLEFSQTLTEVAAAAPPANDACVDAEVIPSLPFSTGPVACHASLDTDNRVWYQWTADADGQVFITTYGSTPGIENVTLQVFQGTCGALGGSVGPAPRQDSWIEMGQSVKGFVAVTGTTYLIRVSPGGTTGELLAGTLSLQMWYRQSPPAVDDLYINCQHVVSLRNGQLININPDFFGFTPTGSAIDYTLRPIIDLNTGLPDTAERLFFQLFSAAIVEILDLATLNWNDSELSYIDLTEIPGYPANAFQSSLVFDRAGDVVLGYFGDGYDVIGTLSTPITMWPRRIAGDVTVTGAGVDLKATYQVAQQVMGSDYVDVASDQTTLWYTSAGTQIKRFNMATNTQLADFATVPNQPGPRPGLRGLRLLPPGDGSGGLLATAGSAVVRLDANGQLIATYQPAAMHRALDMDKVELNQAADRFWVSDQLSTSLFEFDLATGDELQEVRLNLPAGQLCGFSIYQGFRAGLETVPPPGVGCPTDFPVDAGGSGSGCPVAFFP
jgi:hypothetical protein